jgi:hypothetical protein
MEKKQGVLHFRYYATPLILCLFVILSLEYTDSLAIDAVGPALGVKIISLRLMTCHKAYLLHILEGFLHQLTISVLVHIP